MAKLTLQLEDNDNEHKFEGLEATLSSTDSQSEVRDVHNLLSDVHHKSLINFSLPPKEWKTLCEWFFSGKPRARTNPEELQTPAGHRTCARCYPDATDSTFDSSSSSEDYIGAVRWAYGQSSVRSRHPHGGGSVGTRYPIYWVGRDTQQDGWVNYL